MFNKNILLNNSDSEVIVTLILNNTNISDCYESIFIMNENNQETMIYNEYVYGNIEDTIKLPITEDIRGLELWTRTFYAANFSCTMKVLLNKALIKEIQISFMVNPTPIIELSQLKNGDILELVCVNQTGTGDF